MSRVQAAAAALALAVVQAPGLANGAVVAGRGFLAGTGGGGRMQPDVVAHTLIAVEEEWKGQATVFAECNATAGAGGVGGDAGAECARAERAFRKSCGTVVGAVVQASGGSRADTQEYMADVCGQEQLRGWHREQCAALRTALVDSMSMIDVDNRESLDPLVVCGKFFGNFAAAERERVAKERAEDEAREKREADERAAAEQKAAEEAKAKVEADAKARAAEEARAKAAEENHAKEAEEAAMAEEARATATATEREQEASPPATAAAAPVRPVNASA